MQAIAKDGIVPALRVSLIYILLSQYNNYVMLLCSKSNSSLTDDNK